MSQNEIKKLLDDLKSALTELKERVEFHEKELKLLKELMSEQAHALRRIRGVAVPHEILDRELVPIIPRRKRRYEYRYTDVRPIPIRNLDRELYENIKEIAEARGLTIGEVVNEALRFYLENYSLAYLESRRLKLAEKLREISLVLTHEPSIKEYLKNFYMNELEKIEKKLEELREEGKSSK